MKWEKKTLANAFNDCLAAHTTNNAQWHETHDHFDSYDWQDTRLIQHMGKFKWIYFFGLPYTYAYAFKIDKIIHLKMLNKPFSAFFGLPNIPKCILMLLIHEMISFFNTLFSHKLSIWKYKYRCFMRAIQCSMFVHKYGTRYEKRGWKSRSINNNKRINIYIYNALCAAIQVIK